MYGEKRGQAHIRPFLTVGTSLKEALLRFDVIFVEFLFKYQLKFKSSFEKPISVESISYNFSFSWFFF